MTFDERPNVWSVFWRFVLLAMVVTLVLGVFADAGDLLSAFSQLSPQVIVVALLLTLCNQAIRFLKWEYLLRRSGVRLALSTSAHVFGSGLIMILSPGKVGEFWKVWLLRDHHEIPTSDTTPVVAVERLTDLLGVVILASSGVIVFGRSAALLAVVLMVTILIIGIIRHRPTAELLIALFEKVPILGRRGEVVRETYHSSRSLLRTWPLTVTTVASAISWWFECLGLWIILRGFEFETGLLEATFVFAISSIIGALSFLPGGVGATEGSMTFLLIEFGMPKASAVGATLAVRAATLWFSMLIALGIYSRYRRIIQG